MTGAFGRTVVVPLADRAGRLRRDGRDPRRHRLAPALANPAAVSAALESRLKTEPYVLSSPRDLAAALRASTTDFQATTALIAAIALFAGAFLIFNTLSMTVTERIREVGLLRAAGARRGQVMSFMLTQALVLGVIGSLARPGPRRASWRSAWSPSCATVGSVTLDRPAVPLDAVADRARSSGVGVTLAAALEPARRASRDPAGRGAQGPARPARRAQRPAALAGRGVRRRRPRRRRRSCRAPATAAGVVQALVVYAVLLVATLLIPFVLPAVARIAGAPFALLLRFEERLARSSVVRDRSRTALTLGGLTIGLAMIVALGGVGQHARAAAAGWIADVIPGELVADLDPADRRGRGRRGRPRPAMCRASPGSARSPPSTSPSTGRGPMRPRWSAPTWPTTAGCKFIAGDREAALAALDDGGATIVPAGLAERLGLAVGQVLRVPTADGGLLDLRVAGIVERSIPGRTGESMLVGWSDATDQPRRRRGRRVRPPLRARRAGHRRATPSQVAADAAGPRGRAARPDRRRHQRRARPDLRTVRRAGRGGRPDRRAGHRQHADHERRRARPRDRHPARRRA